MPWSSETSLETWSQPGLDGPRGTRKEIEHSYNFQEAVNPKGLRQSSLATPRDSKIEAIYFLQGPLSRLCSWGSPSSDPEKSPRILFFFTQLYPNGQSLIWSSPVACGTCHFLCNISNSQNRPMRVVLLL